MSTGGPDAPAPVKLSTQPVQPPVVRATISQLLHELYFTCIIAHRLYSLRILAVSRSTRQVCPVDASQIPATFCMSLYQMICAIASLRKAIGPYEDEDGRRDGGE